MNADGMFCEDAEEGARWGLLGLMTGISEERWCAGWMRDLETQLWRARNGETFEGGPSIVTQRQADLLRLLSEEAGGWWAFDDTHGPIFLPMEEWLRRLA
jgi:hypothetical protein